MNRREVTKKILLPLCSVLLFLAVWAVAAAVIGRELILPSPLETAREFVRALGSAAFWKSLAGSTWRTLAGFGLSFLLALLLSVPAAVWSSLARFLSPVVTILRAVPTISVIFLLLVFLPSRQVPVLISFLIVFPMLYNGFLAGLTGVDEDLVALSKVYRVPLWVRVRRFYVPSMLPSLFSASRGAVGLNLKIVVAAEALAATQMSLGNLMQGASIRLEGGELLAYTLAAILVSFLLEGIVLLLEKLCVRWKP